MQRPSIYIHISSIFILVMTVLAPAQVFAANNTVCVSPKTVTANGFQNASPRVRFVTGSCNSNETQGALPAGETKACVSYDYRVNKDLGVLGIYSSQRGYGELCEDPRVTGVYYKVAPVAVSGTPTNKAPAPGAPTGGGSTPPGSTGGGGNTPPGTPTGGGGATPPPATMSAVDFDQSVGSIDNPLGVDNIPQLLTLLTQGLLGLISSVAVIMIIIAGFRMVLAQGNESEFKSARNALTYAVYGLILALLAFSIVAVVQRLIQIGT